MVVCDFVALEKTGPRNLILVGRTRGGKRVKLKIPDFEPYFFVGVDEKIKSKHIVREETGYESLFGDELKKIVVDDSAVVSQLATRVKGNTFEDDILYNQRARLDMKIGGAFRVPDSALEQGKVSWRDVKSAESIGALRKMYLDIETEPMREGMKGEPAIYCIGTFSPEVGHLVTFFWREDFADGIVEEEHHYSRLEKRLIKNEVRIYSSEKSMLRAFVEYFREQDPDYICGWNVESFDMFIILKRLRFHGIRGDLLSPVGRVATFERMGRRRAVIKGRIIVDLLSAYKKLRGRGMKSAQLEMVGEDELGIGKLGGTLDALASRNTDWRKLIAYNANDVYDLAKGIDEKHQVTETMREFVNFTFSSWADAGSNVAMVGNFFLANRRRNEILPTISRRKEVPPPFEGGYVMEPKYKGVIGDVYVFDLRRIYPNIIVSLNMSPETIVDETYEGEAAEQGGIRFRQDREGFVPRMVKLFFKARDKVDADLRKSKPGTARHATLKLRKEAIKRILNSVYGSLDFPAARLYCPNISKATAATARALLLWSKERAESWGYEVIYADTDALFSRGFEYGIPEARELERRLNESYNEFGKRLGLKGRGTLQIEFERRYSAIFFKERTSKRYAGLVDYESRILSAPYLDIKGFEYLRSDASDICVEFQKRFFDMVLNGASEDEVGDYVCGLIHSVRAGEVELWKLAVPVTLSKSLSRYNKKGMPIYVRAALFSNRNLGTRFGEGSKLRYLYLSAVPSGVPQTNVIALDEQTDLPDGYKPDYELIARKQIFDKFKPLAEALGWNSALERAHRELTGQQALGDFT
jgi:DNA polymerase I